MSVQRQRSKDSRWSVAPASLHREPFAAMQILCRWPDDKVCLLVPSFLLEQLVARVGIWHVCVPRLFALHVADGVVVRHEVPVVVQLVRTLRL